MKNQSYSIFQMVLRIREWMAGKLLAYFKKDTGCVSRNTWMTNCKRFYILKKKKLLWYNASQILFRSFNEESVTK